MHYFHLIVVLKILQYNNILYEDHNFWLNGFNGREGIGSSGDLPDEPCDCLVTPLGCHVNQPLAQGLLHHLDKELQIAGSATELDHYRKGSR